MLVGVETWVGVVWPARSCGGATRNSSTLSSEPATAPPNWRSSFASPRRNWHKRQDHKHLPRVATSQRATLWQEKHLSAFHPKRLGRIEMLCFVRAGFEFRQHAGPDALHPRRIVRAIARAFVQRARVRASVRKHVSSPCLVVMQANHAMANRTFRIQRVKPRPP